MNEIFKHFIIRNHTPRDAKSPALRPYLQPSSQVKAGERKIFPLNPLRVGIPESHIKRYLGIKKYKCNYNECDMSFVTSNELNAQIHRNEKNQD